MCNEKLDLVKLLGNCPKGTKLYSPITGEVLLEEVDTDYIYPIKCAFGGGEIISFTSEGHYYSKDEVSADGECLLFPSKDNRNWSTFCAYKDGDFLANNDGRAFIFRGKFSEMGNPMAYGGIDPCDEFIECEDNKVWASTPFRKATPEEVTNLMNKMKEAGYMWDANQKVLKKDLPVDTLVVACDSYSSTFYFHSMVVRRYAGNHRCFNNNGGSSRSCNTLTEWRHIIPLDKLIVNKEGVVELDKVTDYGTCNYNA